MKNQKMTEKSYSHQELLDALYWIQDMFDRAMMPFFLVEETAKSIVEERELEHAIHVGIKYTDYVSSGMNILSLLQEASESTNKYMLYRYNDVPVYVHIYKKPNELINNPDFRFYAGESWNVPNNFDEYWQIKHSLT